MNKRTVLSWLKSTLIWSFLSLVAILLGLAPAWRVCMDLRDPALKCGEASRFVLREHRKLTPRIKSWAQKRVTSKKASTLTVDDLIETEWPLFCSFFYLQTTLTLHRDYQRCPERFKRPPQEYAGDAVDASLELLVDPNHATWVVEHWGAKYLEHENAFYRMLLIGGITAHAEITGRKDHLPLLRKLVDDFVADLSASRYGLLYDYPGECYPTDVLAGIACVKEADAILGSDHSAFFLRSKRGFSGDALSETGLIPFRSWLSPLLDCGVPRGSGMAWACIMAPSVWPKEAERWFDGFLAAYWQERSGLYGFREYVGETEWQYGDMDAGPVLWGFGVSASAYGVGACRVNGRFDYAWPLTTEVIAASWPVPGVGLLLPRLLSNALHAPLLGEAGILYSLSRTPAYQAEHEEDFPVPGLVYGIVSAYIGVALLILLVVFLDIRRMVRKHSRL